MLYRIKVEFLFKCEKKMKSKAFVLVALLCVTFLLVCSAVMADASHEAAKGTKLLKNYIIPPFYLFFYSLHSTNSHIFYYLSLYETIQYLINFFL